MCDYAVGRVSSIPDQFKSAVMSADGRRIAGVDMNGCLRAVELSLDPADQLGLGTVQQLTVDNPPANGRWTMLACDKSAQYLFASGEGKSKSAIFRQTDTGYAFDRFVGPSLAAIETCASEDGSRFAIAYEDGSLRLFDSTGSLRGELRGVEYGRRQIVFGAEANLMTFSIDASMLAIRLAGGSVAVRSVSDFESLGRFNGDGFGVSASFSADGRYLAVGEAGGYLGVYAIGSGRRLTRWQGHRAPIIAVRFTDEGSRVQSCDLLGGLMSWNLKDISRELRSIGLPDFDSQIE
jgi:WD40 repeat protein